MTQPLIHTLPAEFTTRISSRLGNQAGNFFESLLEAAPTAIRINPRKWQEEIKLESVPWSKFGFYLTERPSFTLDPLFHGGAYYVQEPSSMLLETAFSAIPRNQPRLILDLCGAPGGKSTHLLTLMGSDDLLISNEVIRSRAAILQENIQKWGYNNVVVTNSDPRAFAQMGPLFDCVVVDAPCSGEGLFRKDSASIAEWSVDNTKHCVLRQRRILSDAWEALRPGGYLIYSTCTYNEAENEENLDWLANERDAHSIQINLLSEWNIESINRQHISACQVYPHKTRGEGFFIGVVQKKETGQVPKWTRTASKKWKIAESAKVRKIEPYIRKEAETLFFQKDDIICGFPERWSGIIPMLDNYLSILQPGLPVALEKGSEFTPHPALAGGDLFLRGSLSEIEVPLESALKFLKREKLTFESAPKGWLLITFRNTPLGWVKNIGNRSNNYYPKERHIRMGIEQIPKPWYLR